jgi:hypothetical protein
MDPDRSLTPTLDGRQRTVWFPPDVFAHHDYDHRHSPPATTINRSAPPKRVNRHFAEKCGFWAVERLKVPDHASF